jgi:hypothetical protein
MVILKYTDMVILKYTDMVILKYTGMVILKYMGMVILKYMDRVVHRYRVILSYMGTVQRLKAKQMRMAIESPKFQYMPQRKAKPRMAITEK